MASLSTMVVVDRALEEEVVERVVLRDDDVVADAPPKSDRASPKPAVKSERMALLSSWASAEKVRRPRARRGMVEREKRIVGWLRGLEMREREAEDRQRRGRVKLKRNGEGGVL